MNYEACNILAPLGITITTKDVFYVIGWEGTFSGDKYVFDNATGYVTGDDWRSPKAARFASPGAAIYALSVFEKANGRELFGSAVAVVRVEAITTPGKSTRVEVPLGDKPPYYAIGSDPGKYWTGNKEGGSKYTRNIYEAAIYAAQRPLLLALQRQAIGGMTPLSNARIIGIADITTPSTTTYTETVLA